MRLYFFMKSLHNGAHLSLLPHRLRRRVVFFSGPADRMGTTLVEVMIAVFVLAIVFVGIFAMLNQGFRLMETAQDYNRVSQILQNQMEVFRSKNWTALEEYSASGTFDTSEFFTEYGSHYSGIYSITTSKTGPAPDFEIQQKQIILTVGWTDTRGMTRTRRYRTFFTKDGLNDYYGPILGQ